MKAHHGKNFSSSFLTGSVLGEGEVNVTSHWIAKSDYTEYKTARVGNWNGVKHVMKFNSLSIKVDLNSQDVPVSKFLESYSWTDNNVISSQLILIFPQNVLLMNDTL